MMGIYLNIVESMAVGTSHLLLKRKKQQFQHHNDELPQLLDHYYNGEQ